MKFVPNSLTPISDPLAIVRILVLISPLFTRVQSVMFSNVCAYTVPGGVILQNPKYKVQNCLVLLDLYFFSDYSSKQCFGDSTWELQTDYSTCSITPRLLRRYRFHIAVLSFSIASCLPAVFIFFFYKRLRVTRVALHRNLLIAIIARNVLVIISRSEVSFWTVFFLQRISTTLDCFGVNNRN